MTSNLYIIYDNVADDIYGGIIRVTNDEVARRAFSDALKNPDSPFKGHESDYDLLLVGRIDNQGTITTASDVPMTIARGADWIAANNQKPELLK